MATLHQFLAENRIENTHDIELVEEIWSHRWGVTNSVGQVRKVLVHRPGNEILELNKCQYEEQAGALILRNEKWRIQSYFRSERLPDLELMQAQHDQLTQALRNAGAEVIELEDGPPIWTNRLFARDLGLVIPGGIILSRFAFYFRQGETRIAQQTLSKLGMPILGAIQGRGCMEGGSFTMLDAKTALVGRSVRVNQEGIDQLRQILSWQGINLIAIDVTADKIHLDESFLLLDRDKALVDPTHLPYWFLEEMKARGIKPIAVDPDDPPLTNNCLAVAPGKVIFPASGVRTMERLAKNGISVIPVDVTEVNKMGGGIHCATLPLIREEI